MFELIETIHECVVFRGAPDPQFSDPAGSGSKPDLDILVPAGSGPDPTTLNPTGSGSIPDPDPNSGIQASYGVFT